MKTKVFIGYAVFYEGEYFPSSVNTVTRDKLYLKASALAKLNLIERKQFDKRNHYRPVIEMLWRGNRRLRLHRVYAH